MSKKTVIEQKREAVIRLMGGHKLHMVGNSYMLAIPAAWCRLYALQVNGDVWVRVSSDAGRLIVEPIDKEEAIKLMEANDVRIQIS